MKNEDAWKFQDAGGRETLTRETRAKGGINMYYTMKKAGMIFPAFFMFLINMVNGQVYFDNLYGDTTSADGIPSGGTVKTDEGYLILSSRYIGQQNHYGFQVDLNGEFINGFYLENSDSISELGGYVLQETDSSFLVMSQWRDLSQSSSVTGDIMLSRINKDGTAYWRRKYGEEQRGEASMSFVLTGEGGVAFVGQVANTIGSDIDGQVYLLKIDSEGNMLWENDFGGSNIENGEDLVQTPDSGFLLLGWTRSYGAGQRDWYLVKTDSLGNQQWQKTYGDANNQSGSCIIATSDGNYVMCGGAGNGASRMIKIDPSGTVIWQFDYAHPEGTGSNYLFKVIELEDGSLVATGLSNNSSQSDAGWLLKTDADGIELWQRRYNKNQHTDLFYSVLLANDGGFLLSGQARNAETNSQDAWLLKVDSVGCPYADCLVGVDEVEKNKVVVDVWPNPANEVLNIELQQQGVAEVRLYDLHGRELLRRQTREMREAIDVSTFENGVYLLTVIQDDAKTTLRVVVQR